jgi:adenylate cyclase class IV
MRDNFESEIRILIDDMGKFRAILKNFDAKIIQVYKFTDHVYIPMNPASEWNLNKKSMRIREYLFPDTFSRILFTENELIQGETFQFKQSKYLLGKLELFKGDKETAEALLAAWDFRLYFKIEKTDGKLYKIEHPTKFVVATEKIAGFGYSAEIERWGEDIHNIEKEFLEIVNLLGLPMNAITSNTLPYIIAKHLDLL